MLSAQSGTSRSVSLTEGRLRVQIDCDAMNSRFEYVVPPRTFGASQSQCGAIGVAVWSVRASGCASNSITISVIVNCLSDGRIEGDPGEFDRGSELYEWGNVQYVHVLGP